MMFKRKLYQTMKSWKNESNGSTALLVEGARRVGKTTLVREFAENEYEDYLYIDFTVASKDVLSLFEEQRANIDTFLRMLQLQFGKRLPIRESVIIFDEVQRFPLAREFVKHLVADGRFDYIETGSLISLKKNVEGIVIPSEEERVKLNPLDFEEYLWALGDEIAPDAIREARVGLTPLPNGIHKRYMRLFDEYMLVGGMPQSVAAFIETKDFVDPEKIKRSIIALYEEDMGKIGGADGRLARAIFEEIPGQLSANSKRFKFSRTRKGARFEDCESALIWLDDASLVNICHECTDPSVGLRLHASESSLKCYMADTGLLTSLAFADGPEALSVQRAVQMGRVSINRGMLVENIVAQQLVAQGHSLFYYAWDEPPCEGAKKPRPREVDFLLTRPFVGAAGKPRICPVEVKSTKSYRTVSLDDFSLKFAKRVGNEIVLHPKQLKVDGHREYLPLYMSFCL